MAEEMTVGGTNGGSRLDSWKAIAAYLGRDMGTVRRWERTRGLPVHRVPGGKGSSVFAYTTEIDAWLQSSAPESVADAPEPLRDDARWRAVAMAAAAIVLLSFLGWWVQRPRASAVDVRLQVTEEAVVARDPDGKDVWSHRLDVAYRHFATPVAATAGVVHGQQPRIYYLTSTREKRSDHSGDGGEFGVLNPDGTERFTVRFHDTVRIGGKDYGEPWALTAFSALDGDPPSRVAVGAHHWTWGPSLIAILDDTGKRLGTFVQDGWIEQLKWLSPDRLIYGGFYQAKDGGMVGLLDPHQLDGQAPEAPDSPHYCQSCATSLPLKMAVMPRSEVNRASGSRFNRAIVETLADRVIVRTVEMPPFDGQGAADAIYEFTPALDLLNVSYSERYWETHERLFADKKIDHDRAHCPDRDGPPRIEVWSRDTGWRVLPRQPRA